MQRGYSLIARGADVISIAMHHLDNGDSFRFIRHLLGCYLLTQDLSVFGCVQQLLALSCCWSPRFQLSVSFKARRGNLIM